MQLIDYTLQWAKGEIFQGKMMVTFSILIIFIVLLNWGALSDSFYKGLVFPLVFLAVVMAGYGTYQWATRETYYKRVSNTFQESPKKALQNEIQKAEKDQESYHKIKILWLCLAGISIFAFYFFGNNLFIKGLSLGLVCSFICFFLVDNILLYRLEIYYYGLKTLI